MNRWTKALLCVAVLLAVTGGAYGLYLVWWNAMYEVTEETSYSQPADDTRSTEYIVVERTLYNVPSPRDELKLVDDVLAEKNPAFDETLVDSRPIGDWQVNASAAVVGLDSPMIKPDVEKAMLVLRPSYKDAMEEAKRSSSSKPLPSANMLAGAAKQFDDGLYAALDLACFRGGLGLSPAAPQWAAAVFAKLPQKSPARPFLAAALELADKKMDLGAAEQQAKDRWLAEFEANKERSKPISFYDWTPELKQVWRFYRFLQRKFSEKELAIPRDVAAVLKKDAELREQYGAINAFYWRLTNPRTCLAVDALIDGPADLTKLARTQGVQWSAVAVFSPSTSRENELFNDLFPNGAPDGVNLMAVLIGRIRSGEVDLKPGQKDGWYQYQVYALETLLLPAKGQEKDKLLLTAAYKKRLVDAFKALVTKQRETHARMLDSEEKPADIADRLAQGEVHPRLRIEPCATFYLRTARAYAFLETFLKATAGAERLKALHGLKQNGQRPLPLDEELSAVGRRFYGFYLITCEDIGMRPQLLEGELPDPKAALDEATRWLDGMENDADLACDTRVSVPIYAGIASTRIWASLGVRLAHLEANYARPPLVRPKDAGGPWQKVESYQLDSSRYVIAVDEFAEITLAGSNALTREELRAACDRYKTKEAIVRQLSGR